MTTSTIEEYRTQLHIELDQARRGLHINLDSLRLSAPSSDPILRAESKVPLIFRRIDSAGHSKALELVEDIEMRLELFEPDRLDPYLRWARYNIHAVLLTGLGRLTEAETKLNVALAVARDTNNERWMGASLTNLAKLQIRTNRPLDASRTLAGLIQNVESETTRTLAYSHLGDLVQLHGQTTQALRYRRIAIDRLGRSVPLTKVWILAPYILNLVEVADYGQAEEALSTARSAASKAASALYSSVLDHVEAVLCLATGRADKALTLIGPETRALASVGHLVVNLCVPHLEAQVLAARSHPIAALARIDAALHPSTLPLDDVRLCTLGAEISRANGDWERTTIYQRRTFEAIQRRQATTNSLLRLHVQSERASQIRETNLALSKINTDLQNSRSARDDVLDIVSHDVMTPLTILRLLLHSYGEQLTSSPPAQHRGLGGDLGGGIDAALRRLETIIPELAVWGDIQELDTAETAAEAERSDIGEVAREVLSGHRWTAKQKGISCSMVVDSTATLDVVGNPSKIAHILENLVSNAIKFSTSGQDVRIGIGPAPETKPGQTLVVITDSGPGLTPSDLDRLFSRYGQVSARPTAGESSTGLGLYIARQLATSVGGELWAESAGRGQGSEFHLLLSIEKRE